MSEEVTTAMVEHARWLEGNPLRMWLEEKRKRNQRMVASALGVSTNTVNNWIKGINQPKPENFEKLALITQVDDIEDQWESWLGSRPELGAA